MKNFEQVFLYTKLKITEIKTDKYNYVIQGNPFPMSTQLGQEAWIRNLIEGLENSYTNPIITLKEILSKTSGLFLLIVFTDDGIIISTDVIRSYPIFYGHKGNHFFITDNLDEFQKNKGPLELDYGKFEEYVVTGNVFGKGTLYKSVSGVQAGEIIYIRRNNIESERYFTFKPAEKPDIYKSITEFTQSFNNLFLYVFSRMVKHTPYVRNWVVPLSGGHDSRLIVNFLFRLGIKNVICFSYGTQNNEQSQISKQVAETLGYKWYFIEYSPQKWKNLHNEGIFGDFIDFCNNGVSTPHIQDFLAIYELIEKGILYENDIILPGHTVVTETVFNASTLELSSEDHAAQYVFSKIKRTNHTKKGTAIEYKLHEIYKESNSIPADFLAIFDWQERQSKYITNSIKVYEYFGFESRQPMWDMEIIDFWLKIPAKDRVGREPLYQAERQGGLIEELLCIPFVSESKPSTRQLLSGFIKGILPEYIIVQLLRLTRTKAKLNEGLNNAYHLDVNSVKDLLEPIEDFPESILPYFRNYLYRLPFQLDPCIITSLFTLRKILDRAKVLNNF